MWQRILLACLVVVLATQSADAWRGRARRIANCCDTPTQPLAESNHNEPQAPEEAPHDDGYVGILMEGVLIRVPADAFRALDQQSQVDEDFYHIEYDRLADAVAGTDGPDIQLQHSEPQESTEEIPEPTIATLDPLAKLSFPAYERQYYFSSEEQWEFCSKARTDIGYYIAHSRYRESKRDKTLWIDRPLDLNNAESIEWLDPLRIHELYLTAEVEEQSFRPTSIFVPVNR